MTKRILFAILFHITISFTKIYAQSNVGIGTNNPDPTSVLELNSTDKGLLIPRTDTNTVNIASLPSLPATGLLIYQTTDNTFYYFDGTIWKAMGSVAIGPTGSTGATGVQGPTGLTGAQGTTGLQVLKELVAGIQILMEYAI